jgi:hypothetical protein
MVDVNVILSCDDNPYYADFWPMTRDIWKRRFDIEPKLVYIDDGKEAEGFEDGILRIKKIDGIPVHLQAQMARIYYAKMFPDDICLLSDIDMFPVSKSFFNKRKIIDLCDQNTFYHLNPESREFGQLPICYYCGYGSLYERLLDGMPWPDFIKSIVDKDFNTDNFNFTLPKRLEGKKLWFSDEIFLYSQVMKKQIPIIKSDELVGNRRLDRENILRFDFFSLMSRCVDIHLPRPYTDYKTSIDNIYYSLIS